MIIIGKSNLAIDIFFDFEDKIEVQIGANITQLTKDDVKTLIEHLTNVLNKE